MVLYLTEIKVTDWHRLVRWYVETLGLRLVLEDAAHEYALLDAAGGRVALKGGGSPGLPRDVVRLVFEVADLEAERDRLARHGEAVSPPEESPEGYRAIRLRDPEGTPITLFCWEASEKVPS
jgi:predicted enzyme related to lactoylglutathione lyase